MALGRSIFVPLAEFLSKSCTNLEFLIEPSVCPHKKQSHQGAGRVASIHRAAENREQEKFTLRTPCPGPLFTQRRRRGVLGSPYPASCIAPPRSGGTGPLPAGSSPETGAQKYSNCVRRIRSARLLSR